MAGDRQQLTAWMTRLADGDRSAFDPLYGAAWPIVQRFTQKTLAGAPEADDIAQDALLKVFERASTFDPEKGDALSWILAIAYHESRTQRRRVTRRGETEPVETQSEAPSPETDVIRQDLRRAVLASVESLSAEDVEVIMAKLEYAERPAISGPAFRKRLQRALTRFKSRWRARHELD